MIATKLPIGVQSFEKIRTEGYKYVDKTNLVYDIANNFNVCFLSRPRRFGKSLLVSTLEAYFLGRKELFEGLAIENLETNWVEYPVLRLDLNSGDYTDINGVKDVLSKNLTNWESLFGLEQLVDTPSLRFIDVISRVSKQTGKKVVVLVDEYDKPLISTIGNKELQNKHRIALKDFYSVLKTCDNLIKFSFLTGVTKFSKVSIFSDLNNFDDISLSAEYYDICGISEGELRSELFTEVEAFARRFKCSIDEAYMMLKENYDGYRFSSEEYLEHDGIEKKIDGIYNPFSLLNALKYKNLKSYWFETGTPTFLIEKIRSDNYEPKNIDGLTASEDELSSVYSEEMSTTQYLFQTGYLTIKDYDRRLNLYTLGYPNNEVKEGFLKCLVRYYSKPSQIYSQFNISNFVLSLESGNVEEFIDRLKAFLASIPYEIIPDSERHVQNVMYLLSTLCGFYCEVESHTNKGRIDMTIKTPKYIYVFELKYDVTAQEALDQIKEKGYAEKFASDPRELICVGINYSSKDRNINEWLIS